MCPCGRLLPCRVQVVARVGRLASLNASAVSKMERWDAELHYLRRITGKKSVCL